MDKNILTIKELAEVTGLPVRTIREGINEGIFPSFQVRSGGKHLIHYEEFQAAVRNLSRRNLQNSNEDSNVISIDGIRRIKE
jgi:excisionase family DNA binding protein